MAIACLPLPRRGNPGRLQWQTPYERDRRSAGFAGGYGLRTQPGGDAGPDDYRLDHDRLGQRADDGLDEQQ